MSKEQKQLNWFLAIMVLCTFAYSGFTVLTIEPIHRPPIQIDTGAFPASNKMLTILADMALSCDIKDEFAEYTEDDILSNDEVRALGNLCVSRAEAAALKDNPFALDIIRNEYDNSGGLSM